MGRGAAFLRGALGDACANYLTRVPRFLANPGPVRNLDFLEIQSQGLVLNLVDGLLFLAAIPLA